jgi:putative ABC transport system substrate-binding protein
MRWFQMPNHWLFVNPTSPNLAEAQSKELQAAARSLGLKLHGLQASTDEDFDTAFASVARLGAGGLVISSDSFFFSRSDQLAALAVRHAVPTIFGFREFVVAGGLMSYGGTLTESFRWVGVEVLKVKMSWAGRPLFSFGPIAARGMLPDFGCCPCDRD